MFLDLGEVALCRGHPTYPSKYTPLLSPKVQGPAGPRVGSDVRFQTRFRRLLDRGFFASLVCRLLV